MDDEDDDVEDSLGGTTFLFALISSESAFSAANKGKEILS